MYHLQWSELVIQATVSEPLHSKVACGDFLSVSWWSKVLQNEYLRYCSNFVHRLPKPAAVVLSPPCNSFSISSSSLSSIMTLTDVINFWTTRFMTWFIQLIWYFFGSHSIPMFPSNLLRVSHIVPLFPALSAVMQNNFSQISYSSRISNTFSPRISP